VEQPKSSRLKKFTLVRRCGITDEKFDGKVTNERGSAFSTAPFSSAFTAEKSHINSAKTILSMFLSDNRVNAVEGVLAIHASRVNRHAQPL
jgi:hypothetical protein